MRVINLIVALFMCVAFVGCKKEEVKPKTQQPDPYALTGYYKCVFRYSKTIEDNAISGNVIIQQKHNYGYWINVYFKGEKGQFIKFSQSGSGNVRYELFNCKPSGEVINKIKEDQLGSIGYTYVYLD